MLRIRKPNKHGAVGRRIDGICFDSGAEAERYLELMLAQSAGRITDLKVHPSYPIEINGIKVCRVELDFEYSIDGCTVYEDVKGQDTPMSKLKRKMVSAQYGIDVTLVKRRRKRGRNS